MFSCMCGFQTYLKSQKLVPVHMSECDEFLKYSPISQRVDLSELNELDLSQLLVFRCDLESWVLRIKSKLSLSKFRFFYQLKVGYDEPNSQIPLHDYQRFTKQPTSKKNGNIKDQSSHDDEEHQTRPKKIQRKIKQQHEEQRENIEETAQNQNDQASLNKSTSSNIDVEFSADHKVIDFTVQDCTICSGSNLSEGTKTLYYNYKLHLQYQRKLDCGHSLCQACFVLMYRELDTSKIRCPYVNCKQKLSEEFIIKAGDCSLKRMCLICEKRLSSKKSVQRHMKNLHCGVFKKFSCPSCQKVFPLYNQVTSHKQIKHGEENDEYKSLKFEDVNKDPIVVDSDFE